MNECKNWKKSAWNRHRAPLEEGAALSTEDPGLESGTLLDRVRALPQMYQEVIFLRYYEGYEVREIAKLLGIPAPLVSTRLRRAKEKLKIMLEGSEYA